MKTIPQLLATGKGDLELEIDGRALKLTNLDKVLWPKVGFTKGQMLGYYAAIADVMVPHLSGRPLTLKRYPNGVDGHMFFQAQCPHPPEWVRTAQVAKKTKKGKLVDQCLVEEEAALVWLANTAAIELHPYLAHTDDRTHPLALVFDLDPGPKAGMVDCCEIALELRQVLERLGLKSFPKTSGSKGIHMFAPLGSGATFDETRKVAASLAKLLTERHPDRVVDSVSRELRSGKVLIDWAQNGWGKSTVVVYSLRAKADPGVSTPLTWDEVAHTAGEGDGSGLAFTPADVLRRVDEHGDLFAPVIELEQSIPADWETTVSTAL